jgi:hypothetical protein
LILFAIHAVVVWALAFRWRRRWLGLGIVLFGAVVPALITGAPLLLSVIPPDWQPFRFGLELKLLFWAEAVIVLGLGLFIVAMPRSPGYPHCAHCRYDIRGLDASITSCPECGSPISPPPPTAPLVPRMARGASSPITRPAPAITPATPATSPPQAAP